MRIFDFKCSACFHITEELVPENTDHVPCSKCNHLAGVQVSPPMLKLSGTDPDFPTAWYSWEKKRNQKMKQEAKQDN